MLDVLSSWIKQIILVVMFTTVVDFLMPNNRFLRYARVLLGLVVMMAIINPLLSFFHKGNYFSDYRLQYYSQPVAQEDVLKRVESINETNNELTIKQYKNNLTSFITNHVSETGIFEVKDINLKILEQIGTNDFGKIENIQIILKPVSGTVKAKKDIQKVSVKISGSDTNETKSEVNLTEYKDALLELKKYLQQQFGLPEKNIQLQLEGE